MQQQLNDITARFFKYFDQRFRGLDNRFKKQDDHIEGLYRLIDGYSKQAEQQEHDAIIGEARVRRLEAIVASIAGDSRKELQS